MGKAEATVEELVSRIERGQLRLPEMQRRYVWRSHSGFGDAGDRQRIACTSVAKAA